MKRKNETIFVRVSPDIKEKIEGMADEQHIPMSEIVRDIVCEKLEGIKSDESDLGEIEERIDRLEETVADLQEISVATKEEEKEEGEKGEEGKEEIGKEGDATKELGTHPCLYCGIIVDWEQVKISKGWFSGECRKCPQCGEKVYIKTEEGWKIREKADKSDWFE